MSTSVKHIRTLTLSAVFAALIFLATAYLPRERTFRIVML